MRHHEQPAGIVSRTLAEGLKADGLGSLPEVSRSEERHTWLLAEGRRISADAAARWPEALRDVDHGHVLYDEQGLPR